MPLKRLKYMTWAGSLRSPDFASATHYDSDHIRKIAASAEQRWKPEEPSQADHNTHSTIDIDEIPSFLSLAWDGITFLIQDFIAEGSITMLTGLSGAGKSTLMLAMGHAISRGETFAGRQCAKRRVLILDRENSPSSMQERFARLRITDDTGLTIWGGWLAQEAPVPAASVILDWVSRTLPRPAIILDTAVRFLTGEENSSTVVCALMSQLRLLANMGATVIILHHSSEKSETAREYRGSSDFKGSIDIGYNLRNSGGNVLDKINLHAFKNRFTVASEISLTYFDGQFLPDNRPVGQSQAEKLTELLRSNPGINKTHFEARAADLGISQKRCRDYLTSNVAIGEIKISRGLKKAQFCYLRDQFPPLEELPC